MKASVRDIGHVSIVDLSGRITIGEGDVQLREAVQGLLSQGSRYILLNLDRVGYMDSAGLAEMVACSKLARTKDSVVKLVNPRGRVYDVLQLTKLDEVFETYQDERRALVSFAVPAA